MYSKVQLQYIIFQFFYDNVNVILEGVQVPTPQFHPTLKLFWWIMKWNERQIQDGYQEWTKLPLFTFGLGALLIMMMSIHYRLGHCQGDAEEPKTTSGKKPKAPKAKLGKETKKGLRAVVAKAKVKATAPAQTLLTQVLGPPLG